MESDNLQDRIDRLDDRIANLQAAAPPPLPPAPPARPVRGASAKTVKVILGVFILAGVSAISHDLRSLFDNAQERVLVTRTGNEYRVRSVLGSFELDSEISFTELQPGTYQEVTVSPRSSRSKAIESLLGNVVLLTLAVVAYRNARRLRAPEASGTGGAA